MPIAVLSTANSTAHADFAALADSVADPFYVPHHAGCASCMRCCLRPHQRDSSEPRGITSRRLLPVCCRLATDAAQSQANELHMRPGFLTCLPRVPSNRNARLTHAVYVVL